MLVETLEVTVRRADPSEYARIDDVVRAAYVHDYGSHVEHSDLYRAAVRDQSFGVWVAVDADGQVVGSVSCRVPGGPAFHEDATADEMDLRLLAVDPGARRRGIAATIMRAIMAHAADVGWQGVFLKSAPEMPHAHRVYERLGFVRDDARAGLWIDGVKILDVTTFVYTLPVATGALTPS